MARNSMTISRENSMTICLDIILYHRLMHFRPLDGEIKQDVLHDFLDNSYVSRMIIIFDIHWDYHKTFLEIK